MRWGFLGAGKVAADFAMGMAHVPSAVISSVGSRDDGKGQAFVDRFGGRPESVEKLLASSDVDVIYVNTPNQCHADHACAAMEAGKHVLVEKPFAMNAAEAKRIVDTARKTGRFCMEAIWPRFQPAFREAIDATKELGDLRLVEASLGFPIEVDPASRVYDKKSGGGAMYDVGVYALHAIHAVLGKATHIHCEGVIGQTDVDESLTALLRYPHGVHATLSASIRHGCRNDLAVHGTHGTLVLDAPIYRSDSFSVTPLQAQSAQPPSGPPSKLKQLTQRPEVRGVMGLLRSVQRTRRAPALGNGFAHEIQEVEDCLARGAKESSIVPLQASLEVMQMVDAILLDVRKS